jgi:putative membrane protein
MLAATTFADPWRFQPNPEVYVLVAFLVGAYIYMVRTIGPRAVLAGEPPIRRRQVISFTLAMVVLFVASTWPIHQIGEDYLYSVHMIQHMMLSYVLPPLVLLATPEWLVRALLGEGRGYRVARFLTRPVIAGVLYNGVMFVMHIPGVVNTATTVGPLHFSLHLLVVLVATLMWMPVIGPLPEVRMTPGGTMVYLFLISVFVAIPSGWLSFAEGAVYSHYGRQPVRVWGMTPQEDQQLAAIIMQVGGGYYLWSIIIFTFFRRFSRSAPKDTSYRRADRLPTAEITGNDEFPLTFDEVQGAFGRSEAPAEPSADRRLER